LSYRYRLRCDWNRTCPDWCNARALWCIGFKGFPYLYCLRHKDELVRKLTLDGEKFSCTAIGGRGKPSS
jgi:hypothetical protein